jgi:hypothetical protein
VYDKEESMSKILAKNISDQIRAGITDDGTTGNLAMLCWGARQFTDIGDGLAFRVSGSKFKGIIEIKLNGLDLYDIRFLKSHVEKVRINNVFCSELANSIDRIVE